MRLFACGPGEGTYERVKGPRPPGGGKVTAKAKGVLRGAVNMAGSGILTHTITNKRLAQAGYDSIPDRYESLL